MIHWILAFSRLGKVRVRRWYTTASLNEKLKAANEAVALILPRSTALCSFIDYKDYKLVYRKYASLYFCLCIQISLGIDQDDNELLALEMIHKFVQALDVCNLSLYSVWKCI
jgi:hypothetical protein